MLPTHPESKWAGAGLETTTGKLVTTATADWGFFALIAESPKAYLRQVVEPRRLIPFVPLNTAPAYPALVWEERGLTRARTLPTHTNLFKLIHGLRAG